MNDDEFARRNKVRIAEMGRDSSLHEIAHSFLVESARHEYSYHFRWLGLPIIQYPQDVIAMQELIWDIKPDAIVETGVARGGSLILYASLLRLLGGDGIVVGVDIEIRPHNRAAIESHPLAGDVRLVEGSSIDPDVVAQVRSLIAGRKRVLVVLDSMHTHQHVMAELRQYSPFVTNGSYLVVFDTCVEHLPEDLFPRRPWKKGDNPWTAVHEFLEENDRFEIDGTIDDKLQITVAPHGYLRCLKG